MGVCMKDHPEEDVREKLSEVQEELDSAVVDGILSGLEQKKWDQPALNELFHALKKLEKDIASNEKEAVIKKIMSMIHE